eukprot:3743882-Rhodomonas_salina.1
MLRPVSRLLPLALPYLGRALPVHLSGGKEGGYGASVLPVLVGAVLCGWARANWAHMDQSDNYVVSQFAVQILDLLPKSALFLTMTDLVTNSLRYTQVPERRLRPCCATLNPETPNPEPSNPEPRKPQTVTPQTLNFEPLKPQTLDADASRCGRSAITTGRMSTSPTRTSCPQSGSSTARCCPTTTRAHTRATSDHDAVPLQNF